MCEVSAGVHGAHLNKHVYLLLSQDAGMDIIRRINISVEQNVHFSHFSQTHHCFFD